ncbi:restriction endonuclease subunit S [Anaerovibrio lipolyticus]|uniref:restriction endonuclease subunit S n=1 Tax=Anaerovibrio lipolyticus TaxID=82374 RepID=UPI0026F2C908|nr:restriction endonuclease subunit S [Anaerovibrio lipolyticus]MBE6105989.1 restriction endonuclease [Anaerovibrio lipolyticus]
MMTAQQLKNSILQRAIEGKLVEQRPEEGTAKELLQEIKLEKEKLVKEGKIKKSKPLPAITEEEIPFEIPESWEWVRLGEIAIFENGDRSKKYPTEKDFCTDGIPFLGAKDMVDGYISLQNVRFITKDKYEELGQGKLKDKDIVCLLRGSVGKMAIFKETAKYKTGFICAQMLILRFVLLDIVDTYFTLLNAPYIQTVINSKVTGTAVRQLPAKELRDLIVPLIPLAEQYRIVTKIEELMPLVDQYDKAFSQLRALNEKFPQDMKKSILQYAIEGKLVEQRPEEGTAKELLKEIKLEKEKLVKEGKIKKSKPLPPITEEEIPFEIPDSWLWCRFIDVLEFINGRAYKKDELLEYGKYKVLRVGNFFTNENWYYSDLELEDEKYCISGDLLYAWSASFGPKIWSGDKTIFHYHIWKVKFNNKILYKDYLYWYFKYDVLRINRDTTGSAMKHVSMSNMLPRLIPVPPIEEQKRIVEKLEYLLPSCDKLMVTNNTFMK